MTQYKTVTEEFMWSEHFLQTEVVFRTYLQQVRCWLFTHQVCCFTSAELQLWVVVTFSLGMNLSRQRVSQLGSLICDRRGIKRGVDASAGRWAEMTAESLWRAFEQLDCFCAFGPGEQLWVDHLAAAHKDAQNKWRQQNKRFWIHWTQDDLKVGLRLLSFSSKSQEHNCSVMINNQIIDAGKQTQFVQYQEEAAPRVLTALFIFAVSLWSVLVVSWWTSCRGHALPVSMPLVRKQPIGTDYMNTHTHTVVSALKTHTQRRLWPTGQLSSETGGLQTESVMNFRFLTF